MIQLICDVCREPIEGEHFHTQVVERDGRVSVVQHQHPACVTVPGAEPGALGPLLDRIDVQEITLRRFG